MRFIRNRARFFAAIALTWQVAAIAAVATVLSYDRIAASKHAGMENCPLHSQPTCPLHGDKHGTHDCDCPTIGCSQTDTGFMALFGSVGILPAISDVTTPLRCGEAAPTISLSADLIASVPLAPPPRPSSQ